MRRWPLVVGWTGAKAMADARKVLGIANPSDAAKRLEDDEKHTLDNTEGGKINGLGTVGPVRGDGW